MRISAKFIEPGVCSMLMSRLRMWCDIWWFLISICLLRLVIAVIGATATTLMLSIRKDAGGCLMSDLILFDCHQSHKVPGR